MLYGVCTVILSRQSQYALHAHDYHVQYKQ